MNCLPQRRNFLPQGSPCGCRKTGKTGLRKAFPAPDGVRPRANLVCPFASHSPCGADAGSRFLPHGVPWLTAKCRRNRLSAFILHSLGRVRFAHFRLVPSRARLRGSRRGCLDVLTICHWGFVAVRRPLGAFTTGGGRRCRNRQREFPRAVFLSFPEPLKHTAVPTGFLLSLNSVVPEDAVARQ